MSVSLEGAGITLASGGGGGSGTVTNVSVVSANGLAGSVANATTTPAITLSTTITGILSGNGTAIAAASTTGSGNVVLATSPTLVTPALGVATATSLNGATITTTSGGTLTLANSSTLATSGANSITLTSTGATNITLPTTGTVSTLAGTETFTNKRINPRVVAVSDATSFTPNADTSDIVSQTNTQSAGTLTVGAPSGTPVDGQMLTIRLKSTNAQTFSWNAIYRASTDLALPTVSSASGKWDYVLYEYNSADTKWDILAVNFGH